MFIYYILKTRGLTAIVLILLLLSIITLAQSPDTEFNPINNSTVPIPAPGWLQWSQS